MPKLILASSSPRRRELLSAAGYDFEVVEPSPTAECGICSKETPPELVARLAFQKAQDVVERLRRERSAADLQGVWVIGCDTVAECLGQILGKPSNAPHARQMLTLLSGREHHTYSGLCLWNLSTDERHVAVDRTTLQMENLSDHDLESYLATKLWEGKAGAFGYQDQNDWLKITAGSPSNVVGLPLELLAKMISQHGGFQQFDQIRV